MLMLPVKIYLPAADTGIGTCRLKDDFEMMGRPTPEERKRHLLGKVMASK